MTATHLSRLLALAVLAPALILAACADDSPPEGAVLTVGEQHLTAEQLAEARRGAEQGLRELPDLLEHIGDDYWADRVQALEAAGVDVVALSAAIWDLALFDEAARRGLVPTDDELDGHIEDQRAQYARLQDSGDPGIAEVRARIAEVGEDAFWSSFRETSRRGLAVAALRHEVIEDDSDGIVYRDRAWLEFQREFVDEFRVRVHDRSLVSDDDLAAARELVRADLDAQLERAAEAAGASS